MAKADETKNDAAAQAAQDEKDRLELEELEAQLAEENEAKGKPLTGAAAAQRRAQLQRKVATREQAAYEAEATEEVTVARGRTIVSGPAHALVENTQGMTLKVTPAEALKLRQSGHVVRNDGTIQVEQGPKVYSDAGLIQGHAPGQGHVEDAKSK